MSFQDVTLTILIGVASIVFGSVIVHLAWQAIGAWRVSRAGPRFLAAIRHVLWRDPGAVEALDISSGPGGAEYMPMAPFTFLEEHHGGSQPCVSVRDARGRRWRVKWGDEVRSETFAVRLVWACGYFAETTYFVAEGKIDKVKDLQRARSCIDDRSRFVDARFELDDPARGSNTAIFEQPLTGGAREAHYLITDWGGSMGRWGSNPVTRGRWDLEGFEDQTPQFVTSAEEDIVKFGYTGQRTEDVAAGITTRDVRWLCGYLGRITDAQQVSALRASGGSEEEATRFSAAIRKRIDQLQRAAATQST